MRDGLRQGVITWTQKIMAFQEEIRVGIPKSETAYKDSELQLQNATEKLWKFIEDAHSYQDGN